MPSIDPRSSSSRHLAVAACVAVFAWVISSPALAAAAPPVAQSCLRFTAESYNLKIDLLAAVLAAEGGRVGLRKRNTNGTYDMGPMQINSIWLPELGRRGITEEMVTSDYCTNVLVGAWILAREIKQANASSNTPEFWRAVGRYHSRTPHLNASYAVRVWYRAKLRLLATNR